MLLVLGRISLVMHLSVSEVRKEMRKKSLGWILLDGLMNCHRLISLSRKLVQIWPLVVAFNLHDYLPVIPRCGHYDAPARWFFSLQNSRKINFRLQVELTSLGFILLSGMLAYWGLVRTVSLRVWEGANMLLRQLKDLDCSASACKSFQVVIYDWIVCSAAVRVV
jgi:hypothetical protein